MSGKTYIVYDIETAGLPIESFDDARQEYLLRGASTDETREKKINEMALSPLTGQIICLGVKVLQKHDGEWSEVKAGAFMVDPSFQDTETRTEDLPSGHKMVLCSETKLLEHFWKLLTLYPSPHLITFNGRGFDAPFVMLRSALLKVKPLMNLMQGTRWNYRDTHSDLLDELCFFNPQNSGATRRYNFDFVAKAFGVQSPKEAGVDGSKVGELYAEGKYGIIAEYCLRDVKATWELYLAMKEFIPDIR
ncbi:MAG: ribonuclease H-like domain-containing protein [bacterium]